MAKRIRIGVVYGGRSSEHAISVVSAGSVLAALDPARYEVITLGITRDGAWVRTEVDPKQLAIANRQLPQVAAPEQLAPEQLAAGQPAAHRPRPVTVFDRSSAVAELDSLDVVLPMLHGAYGEDGTIQGLLEMAGIAYVGSGVLASAAAMDKVFTKTVLAAAGIPVAPYLVVRRGQPVSAEDVEQLGLPLFVKPARAGSSVGISRVSSYEELPDALERAFEHDRKVLIEAAVVGREIECGVLQDADGTVSASPPAEIRLHPDFDWYSFDAKYLDDASDFDIPAGIGEPAIKAVQELACQVFQVLECAGLARVDCFLTADDQLIVNEVNTMPGFTPISMYPKMWDAAGVGYAELLDRLIATALAGR
ncbi:MAG: D-alanine--D-alanine ligase [Actinomycetota bacterium]|nr:D-alanine--D-alanine ligase [Actinomycetota bacterium]MDQ2956589.1 D-alanine--D-alanine ligase [Actinomycetota bacterium]